MTNTEIIYHAAQAHGFTSEQLAQLTAAYNGDLPFHTFADWISRGYHVKRGEKALFSAELWKHTSKPSKSEVERAAQEGREAPEESPHFYRTTAHLFSFAQVEPNTQPKK